MSNLVIGCGYVGHRVATEWAKAGEEVFVTTRCESRARQFQSEGLKPLVLDVTQTDLPPLPAVENVLFAVGFDRSAGHQINQVYVDGLRNILNAYDQADVAGTPVSRFIYVSSTGVYGQTDGDWIDEDSDCRPNRPGGKACLDAEKLLQQHRYFGRRSIVLRLAGIYGPGRLPQRRMLEQGEPLEVAADAWLNLIHVDDAVQIINQCRDVATPTTLCVSDGAPVARGDFYRYLADLLELPPPMFAPPAEGSSRAERARGSKRVRNQRLMTTLDYTFAYQDYQAGLRAIVGSEMLDPDN